MSRMRTALVVSAIMALAALAPAPAGAGKANNTLIFASDLVPESIDAYLNRDTARSHKVPIWYSTRGSVSINDASTSVSTFFTFSADDVRMENYKKALDRISDQAYWIPLSSWPVVYAYAKDLDFTLYTDKLPRFWEAKWK